MWSTHTRYTLWLVLQRAWQSEWLERGTGRERVSKKRKCVGSTHFWCAQETVAKRLSFFLDVRKLDVFAENPTHLSCFNAPTLFQPNSLSTAAAMSPPASHNAFRACEQRNRFRKCDNCTLMEFKDIPWYTHSLSLHNTHAEDTCRVSMLQCRRGFTKKIGRHVWTRYFRNFVSRLNMDSS